MSQDSTFAATVPFDPPGSQDARFAPPKAHVEAIAPPQGVGHPMWFSVSPLKMVVLNIVTMQLYSLYWFYKQWALVRDREQITIFPALRAIFAVFFVWSLCRRVWESEGAEASPWGAGVLAAGWIVASLLWKLPEPYWWITMIAPFFLMPVQSAMNRVNDEVAPGHARNDRFTAVNWVGIVLGGLFVVLALIGTFLPDEV